MARFLGTPVTLEQSAGAVVFRRTPGGEPQILLIRDRYGNWGLPKGHIEEGESAEQAALRECREETGLERTRTIARLGTIDWYFRFGDASVHKYCDYFLVEAADGEEPAPQHEHGVDRVRWAAPDEALGDLTYENARRVVREALGRLRIADAGPEPPGARSEPPRAEAVAEPRMPEVPAVRQVFLTGGTGFVGGHLALELAERGHRLRALVRHPRRAEHLRELGADLVMGDVTRPETLTGAMDGCDVVVHLVGIIREKRPHATFRAVHVEGTRYVVEEASSAGVERFVHMSALDASPEGTPYHRTKYEAEGVVRAANPTHLIFRPTIIVGEGSEFLAMIMRMVRFLPVVPVIGGGQYRIQPIAIEDVTAAFAQAVERDDLRDRTLEIGGPHRLTYNRVIEIVAEEMGRRRRKLHLPLALVRPMVGTATRLRLPTPIDAHELAMLLQENVVHEERVLRDVFGIDPTPLRTVLQRIREARRS